MSYLNDAQLSALVDAEQVMITCLIEAQFTSETMRITEESVPFTDTNSVRWEAGHGLISYSDFQMTNKASAGKRTYRLAVGDSTLAAAAVGMESEFRGQPIIQYLQFFTHNGPTRQAVGSPLFLARHIMDRLSLAIAPGGGMTLSMECEGLFVTKGRSPYGLITQTDQRARYPDDAGLDRLPDLLRGKVVRWPDF